MISSPQTNAATTSVGVAAALGSSAVAGQQPSLDAQIAGAISKLLPPLVDDLMRVCKERTATVPFTFPEPQCDWFTYRPTTPQQP